MIEREMTKRIIELLDYDKIIILKGARQTGKTTILRQVKDYLENKKFRSFYISADSDFENIIFKTPEHFTTFLKSKVSWKNSLYLFIDEFQYIKQAGIFLKVLYDLNIGLKIIVSGSSTLEISKNSEFLTGRSISKILPRISFFEYLRYKNNLLHKQINNADITELTLIYEVNKNELETIYAEYFSFGAYPEILTTQNEKQKKELLQELVSIYLQKDVSHFLRVKNISGFNNLVKILLQESGNLLNKDSLAVTVRISINTLNHYLDILQGTFIFDFIPPFYTNIRKEVSKMKKIILQDFGFNVILNHRKINDYNSLSGFEAETMASLAIKNALPENKLYHYRTLNKAEIDFIIESSDGIITPLEVKFRGRVSLPSSFKNFREKYNCPKAIIATKELFKVDNDVYYIPLPLLEHFLRNETMGFN